MFSVAQSSHSATLGSVGRRSTLLVVGLLLLTAPRMAEASLFGGFAKDGQYRRGTDQLCQAVTQTLGSPTCATRNLRELAQKTFDMGSEQTGAGNQIEVKKSGSRLKVLSADGGEVLATWDSGDVIEALAAIRMDKSGRWVAIEYTTRFGGRSVDDLVVLTLRRPAGTSPAPAPAPESKPPAAKSKTPAPKSKTPPAFVKALKTGIKWSARRKHKKAIVAFRQALRIVPEHPEALYRLSRSLFSTKDRPAALMTLQRIPRSKHPEATRWRVEARFDRVFKPLRGDAVFRLAVGIDRKPDDPVTTYERLVGLGGHWEQELLACEEPRVNLNLRRNDKSRFDLIIRSNCQGYRETTRLDGRWAAGPKGALRLHFPNTDTDDEDLVCRLELCTDGSGEDCLRCQPEPDIEFLLRVVRR